MKEKVLIIFVNMERYFMILTIVWVDKNQQKARTQNDKYEKDANVSIKQADKWTNSRERHRKSESFSQVHAHEGHVGDAVDCWRTPDDQEEHFSEQRSPDGKFGI